MLRSTVSKEVAEFPNRLSFELFVEVQNLLNNVLSSSPPPIPPSPSLPPSSSLFSHPSSFSFSLMQIDHFSRNRSPCSISISSQRQSSASSSLTSSSLPPPRYRSPLSPPPPPPCVIDFMCLRPIFFSDGVISERWCRLRRTGP